MAMRDAGENAGIDVKLIRNLAKILDEINLSDIEVESNSLRIRVSRSVTQMPFQAIHMPQAVNQVSPSDAGVMDARTECFMKNAITSPMVGTAYLAPSPGARPFVKVGQKVDEGQTLLIVEAMKTMNQISSPRSGIIRQILIDDAQPVEFGEPLIIVE